MRVIPPTWCTPSSPSRSAAQTIAHSEITSSARSRIWYSLRSRAASQALFALTTRIRHLSPSSKQRTSSATTPSVSIWSSGTPAIWRRSMAPLTPIISPSVRTSTTEYRRYRPHQDHEIEPEAPTLDILEVEPGPLIEITDLGATHHLPETGYPRYDGEFAPLPGLELRELRRRWGTRPDEAHITAQDTPELRQLVETILPQEPTKWGDPWIVDRKSTRLNSSHVATSYAVFCLKKKRTKRSTRSATSRSISMSSISTSRIR